MAIRKGVPAKTYELFKTYLDMLAMSYNAEHYEDFKKIGKWFYKPKEQKLDEKDYGQAKRCAENSINTSDTTGKRISVGFMFLEDIPIPIEHIVNLVTDEKNTVSVYDTSPGSKNQNTWYFLVETSLVLLKHLNDIPGNRANPPEMLLDA